MSRPFSSQGVRNGMADLLEKQEAYLEAYEALLRMGLDATEKYGMDEGAVGFQLLHKFNWPEQVREHGKVLRGGADILAGALQDAEETFALLTAKAEGGVQ